MVKPIELDPFAEQFVGVVDTVFEDNRGEIIKDELEQRLYGDLAHGDFPFARGGHIAIVSLTRPKPKKANQWRDEGGLWSEPFDDGHQLSVTIVPREGSGRLKHGNSQVRETYGIRGGSLVRDVESRRLPIGSEIGAEGQYGGVEEIPSRSTKTVKPERAKKILKWLASLESART